VFKRSTDADVDTVINVYSCGSQAATGSLLRWVDIILIQRPSSTLDKRRVGNQISPHPFLHHHLSVCLTPNYDQLSLSDRRYVTAMITSPFMTYPMAAGLTRLFGWEPKAFAWVPDFTSGASLSRRLSSP
jgi:hypothetical protein